MSEELLNSVLSILLPALATLLATWFAVLGSSIKAKYDEKVNTQIKKDVVDTTVNYVQQLFYDLNGEEKLNKALERASLILSEKNINISEVELRTLVESAVLGMKKGLTESSEGAEEQGEEG